MIRSAMGALVLLACLAANAAKAETLVTSLSSQRVQIGSNFVGADLTLFGVIERGIAAPPRAGTEYDLIIVARGPRINATVREKQSLLGFWINRDRRMYYGVPSVYMVASSKPIEAIADLDLRRKHQIGADALDLYREASNEPGRSDADRFRKAFVRLQSGHGLYQDLPGRVEFVTPALFKATLPVPAVTPTGGFEVEAFLFSGKTLLARSTTHYVVTKYGFEAAIARMAHEQSLLYGLLAVALSLVTGWFANVVFRRA